ncbi:MAG: hypothetical protein NC209_05215 [Alistipes sp.]|nr:hypothetical protein [Alistipes senegalensis]MCM1250524.1 hypothetical protein [Alistipes sp.]
MKRPVHWVLLSFLFVFLGRAQTVSPVSKVVVAYVSSWTDDIPDPHCMTHINYAFTDGVQNLLFLNAFRWVSSTAPNGNPFE